MSADTPTGKKVKADWSLAGHVEARAIPYLECHPILWDKTHPDHANRDIVKQAWKAFSEEMDGAYSG
jgi:hypothetical protein